MLYGTFVSCLLCGWGTVFVNLHQLKIMKGDFTEYPLIKMISDRNQEAMDTGHSRFFANMVDCIL